MNTSLTMQTATERRKMQYQLSNKACCKTHAQDIYQDARIRQSTGKKSTKCLASGISYVRICVYIHWFVQNILVAGLESRPMQGKNTNRHWHIDAVSRRGANRCTPTRQERRNTNSAINTVNASHLTKLVTRLQCAKTTSRTFEPRPYNIHPLPLVPSH